LFNTCKPSPEKNPMKSVLNLAPWSLVLLLAAQAFAAAPNRETRKLRAFLEREWEYTMEQSPTWASSLGDRRWNDRWNDSSLAAIERRHTHAKDGLAELRKISRRALPEAEQLNFDLYEKQLVTGLEEHEFKGHYIALDQRSGVQQADELADSLQFASVKDYEDWIARLKGVPAMVAQDTELLRAGIAARMVLPKITAGRIPAQIAKQVVDAPERSPFFKPFTHFPAGIAAPDRERLAAAAAQAIRDGVIPAYRQFGEFFSGTYLPACFDQVGAWQMPNGKEYYAFLARKFTTTELAPDAIHALGLKEVARIRQEMEAVKESSGFTGTLPEFFHFLRTDRRFQCATPEELLHAYRAVAKRIDPLMVKVFRTLPRIPYGLEPIPDKVAPDTTAAYYRQPAADGSRAGSYFVNLYRPETRYKWEMIALSLHEAVPGHHHQIALAMEQGELPPFRRHLEMTAYVEGWALYAEHLGDEMGLYEDPFDRMGKLSYEMWRAVRLVVDTGIHHLRWPREQAIQFFKDNAPRGEHDIVNEIDRYISWPGQALAYKIGELKIKELRAKAERWLGAKFDVKGFHDTILLSGSMPLDLLEARVSAWIDGQAK